MRQLNTMLHGVSSYEKLHLAVDNGACPVAVTGLALSQRAHMAAALYHDTKRPILLVCGKMEECENLRRDLSALTGVEVATLPSRPFTFHHVATLSHQWEHSRIGLMAQLLQDQVPLMVATVDSLLQYTIPKDLFLKSKITLTQEGSYDLSALGEGLVHLGYQRCQQVEGVGQFALRGGILDVFSPAHERPIRCEFFGDEVDSMGFFDLSTQRRTQVIQEATILPSAETLPHLSQGGVQGLAKELEGWMGRVSRRKGDNQALLQTLTQDRERFLQEGTFPAVDRYLALIYPQKETLLHYLSPDTILLMSESGRVGEGVRAWHWQSQEDAKDLIERGILLGDIAHYGLSEEGWCKELDMWPVCYLDTFASSSYPLPPRTLLSVTAKQLPAFGTNLELAVSDLAHYVGQGYTTVVLVSSEQRALNLQALLKEQGHITAVDFALVDPPKKGRAVIAVGGLTAGMEYTDGKIAILAEGRGGKKKREKPPTNRQKLGSYADLTPGCLVVHLHHGVGRFVEMTKMTMDGVEKDYIKLAYAGGDTLYVPATQLDLVSKYIGGGEDAAETKKLHRLGGADWQKAKTRAKKAVQDLAKGLIELYAQRQRQVGYAFSPDSPWMTEFEEQFEYAETHDQLKCIAEVKRDMEQPRPMDRLLCGDVGYGKTEVALRGVMKAVLDGKQAAILVPTTVLARQHYFTARERFAKYPIEIEVISRFRTPAQMKDALKRLKEGRIDLLIGTHRLFQKDVEFKDLGLLVVDEEQRFGVVHKEKLKELARQVDVLTLSATPIPRTLNMALSGIRDMSTLEEPPAHRQPVQTYVLEQDWTVLGDAMRRELSRGGQVYYLHNRVETISRTASRIQAIVGEEARVAVAHGKMTQEELSHVMTAMVDGGVDVLVCTTIIETGIDIANANTLIIEDADKMGLSQLHQIRGRVGRSSRRAYAYLTYRQGKILTEVATKRLAAIREFAEFGSGFKIAMRDLEIRGAGNLLGPEQSGFMLSVGYDMYLKLLEEAVLEERGEKLPRPTACEADLSVAASIPDRYVPSPEERMDLYRRIAAIRSEEDGDDLVDELVDRYGDPPRTVNNLISVALLRAKAAQVGIIEIAQKKTNLNLFLEEVDLQAISTLCAMTKYRGRLLFSPGEKPYIAFRLKGGDDVLRMGRTVVEDYAGTLCL